MMIMRAIHTIDPIFDTDSSILILGSFPSIKSRQACFYYHHPQNRFWKVVSSVLGQTTPLTIEQKKEFLHRNHIALWDVIKSCKIENSSDSSIKDVQPNDLSLILNNADIKMIFTNGSKAGDLYKRLCQNKTGMHTITLPSTSPANARFSENKLIDKWIIIKDFIF